MSVVAVSTTGSATPAGASRISGATPHGPAPRISFRALLLEAEVAGLARSPGPAMSQRAHFALSTGLPAFPSIGDRPDRHPAAGLPVPGDDDPLDPIHRRRAALAPPDIPAASSFVGAPFPSLTQTATPEAMPTARTAASLEDLIPAIVRRIAWSGDRHRGTLRLEIGAGELAGATLLVHADAGRVRVHMEVPPGVDADGWQRRIQDRLVSRGVATDAVEVT